MKPLTGSSKIIGEAASHLSPEARKRLPAIPWRLITAMRNILIHDYDDVNLNLVWDTIRDDLPLLITKIDTYLSANPDPDQHPS